jgi:LysR family transcriptional regulator, benzoate and cis,cis-muconate-responsive activator of ben and cat genes
MELKRLNYFATTAAEGSFRRASARLNIAQPALSRQIRDLEEDLGVTVFIRSTKGVKLSPAGEVLLTEVKRLLPQVELAKTKVKRAALGQLGIVRIAFTTLVAESRFAMAALADARRLIPEVDFRLSLINSDQQTDAMVNGEIDLGLLYRRDPIPAGMVYRDLRVDSYQLVVPTTHPLTRRHKVWLADLREENLIFVSPLSWAATYKEMMGACLRGGLTPRILFEGIDNEAITTNIVAAGIALGFCNSSLANRRPIPGCTLLTIEDLDVPLHLAAMWPRDRETPAIVRFTDLVLQHMDAGKEVRNFRKIARAI